MIPSLLPKGVWFTLFPINMGNKVGKKLLAGNRMESNNPNENMLTNNTQHIPAFKEQNVLHNNQFLNDTTFAWYHACI